MLRKVRVHAWMLLIALCVAGQIGSFSPLAQEPPKPSGEAEKTTQQNKKDNPSLISAGIVYIGHFVHDYRDEITAVSTVVIAVFTTVLGVFTVCLAKSTRIAANAAEAAAKVAEDSLIAANRPAIAITHIKLCEANEFQEAPHINFDLVNSGKGTAIINDVSAIVGSEYGGIGLATNPPINSLFVPSDIINEIEPGQPMSGCPITAPFLGAQELQQIRSGGRTLRVTFHISFRDKFKNRYTPAISFDFDHGQNIFVTRSRLIPKK